MSTTMQPPTAPKNTNRLGYVIADYKGGDSTLCAGCGHDAITSQIIKAFYEYGVDLFPGDIIGSGTVGTGCFLELNGTGKLNDPNFQEQWLNSGDVVEMEIEELGILSNTIVAEETEWSILKRKKV